MLSIAVDTSDLDALIQSLTPDLKKVTEAVNVAGNYVADVLYSVGYGAMFPGMTRKVDSPEFAESVTHVMQGPTDAIVSADPSLVSSVQNGKPGWDMKPSLLSGPKARTSKKGVRYNIIPFNHNSSGLSDQALSALVNNVRNFQTNIGMRSKLVNGHANVFDGQYVRRGYLPVSASHYTWTTGHESGIRMGYGGPVTFRTVSDRSNPASWWYPSTQDNPIFEAVYNATRNDVEEWILEAWWEAIGFGPNSR